jgi:hypothetical protein
MSGIFSRYMLVHWAVVGLLIVATILFWYQYEQTSDLFIEVSGVCTRNFEANPKGDMFEAIAESGKYMGDSYSSVCTHDPGSDLGIVSR